MLRGSGFLHHRRAQVRDDGHGRLSRPAPGGGNSRSEGVPPPSRRPGTAARDVRRYRRPAGLRLADRSAVWRLGSNQRGSIHPHGAGDRLRGVVRDLSDREGVQPFSGSFGTAGNIGSGSMPGPSPRMSAARPLRYYRGSVPRADAQTDQSSNGCPVRARSRSASGSNCRTSRLRRGPPRSGRTSRAPRRRLRRGRIRTRIDAGTA